MRSTAKAASLAALIQKRLHIEARVVAGKTGQFDVKVNEEQVASRGGNVLTRILFGAGFPDLEEVVSRIEKARAVGSPPAPSR